MALKSPASAASFGPMCEIFQSLHFLSFGRSLPGFLLLCSGSVGPLIRCSVRFAPLVSIFHHLGIDVQDDRFVV